MFLIKNLKNIVLLSTMLVVVGIFTAKEMGYGNVTASSSLSYKFDFNRDNLKRNNLRSELETKTALLNSTIKEINSLARIDLKQDSSFSKVSLNRSGLVSDLIPLTLYNNLKKTSFNNLNYSHDSLINVIDEQIERLRITPVGSPARGKLSSKYGTRISPFTKRTSFHKGVDFSLQRRSPIVSTADGIVTFAGYKGAYGYTVIISHDSGLETLYAHMSAISVAKNQSVKRGQEIGLVGSTGRSTGPHVHYEIRHNARTVDPLPFVELAGDLTKIDADKIRIHDLRQQAF